MVGFIFKFSKKKVEASYRFYSFSEAVLLFKACIKKNGPLARRARGHWGISQAVVSISSALQPCLEGDSSRGTAWCSESFWEDSFTSPFSTPSCGVLSLFPKTKLCQSTFLFLFFSFQISIYRFLFFLRTAVNCCSLRGPDPRGTARCRSRLRADWSPGFHPELVSGRVQK